MTISILGAGAFGGALAISLAARGPVTLWGRTPPQRVLPRLPGTPLPDGVTTTGDLGQALAPIILLAIPAQQLRGFLAENAAALDGRMLVSCAKGIDRETLQGPSTLIAQACPNATVAVLTGPSFAADIARGLPTALTLACRDPDAGKALQNALTTPNLRLYRSPDLTGAELGGALKNVVAIAAGAAIGAGLGDSARAAIVTRGFAEMQRIAASLGADPVTLTGLSGLGDLMLTATSDLSRNYRFGKALGAGAQPDPTMTVEGAATAQAVARMAPAAGIEAPVCTMTARLSDGQTSVTDAVKALLNRPLKEE